MGISFVICMVLRLFKLLCAVLGMDNGAMGEKLHITALAGVKMAALWCQCQEVINLNLST